MTISTPFPWFGGKSRVAPQVWEAFGPVQNYVEPFFGSGAVMLGRPTPPRIETINDLDGYVCNFWRALRADPEGVAGWCDFPVSECELHARHIWLVERKAGFTDRLMADPDFFDSRAAGYWVWGISAWIGSGWCSGSGAWVAENGLLVKAGSNGVNKQLPHLGNSGMGVHKKRPHLGDAGMGWFEQLADRLRRVRICCGDWSRVCGHSVTHKHGVTGVFLDPPYADTAGRDADLYTEDSLSVAHDVREWAIANGDHPKMRIALCGYEGEHVMPESWRCVPWKAGPGYGSQSSQHDNPNAGLERIWFSPHCLNGMGPLFAEGLI